MDILQRFADLSLQQWAVVAITVAVLVLYFRFKVRSSRRQSKKPPIMVTECGLFKITPETILSYEEKFSEEIAPLPVQIIGLIKNHTSKDLAGLLFDIEDGATRKSTLDKKRAITIAAALYGFFIPHQLVLLDARTAYLYLSFKYQLRLVGMEFDVEDIVPPEGMAETEFVYLRKQITAAGNLLLYYAQCGFYPPFDVFANAFNINFKYQYRLHGRTYFTEHEIRSLVIAYAAVTKTKIPHEYIAAVRDRNLAGALAANKYPSRKVVQLSLIK